MKVWYCQFDVSPVNYSDSEITGIDIPFLVRNLNRLIVFSVRNYFCPNILYSKRNNHYRNQFIVRRFQSPLVYIPKRQL